MGFGAIVHSHRADMADRNGEALAETAETAETAAR